MHKTNYIQLYGFGGVASAFSSLSGIFAKQQPGEQISAQLNGKQDPALTKSTQGQSWFGGKQAMGLATGAAQAFSGTGELTGAAKSAAMGDNIVGGVSTALSSIGPYGAAIGAGLNLINGIGGSLMNNNKTAKMAKDFTINGQVQQSSSYGGIAAGATDAQMQGNSYRKAGLFGKLATNTGKLQNQLKNSNMMQQAGAGVLNTAQNAFAGAAGSTDMANNNLQQKNYNSSGWNNGSIQFGQAGTKLLNTKTSVVDYLASTGREYNQEARRALAEQYGVKDYDLSAAKNQELLGKLKAAPSPNKGYPYKG